MSLKNKPYAIGLVALAAVSMYGGLRADSELRSSIQSTHQIDDIVSMPAYGASASADTNIGLNVDLGPLDLVTRVLKVVKDYYVEPVEPFENSKMAHNAVKYMVASLGDHNSKFMSPEQNGIYVKMAQGEFSGAGLVLKVREVKTPDYTDMLLTVVTAVPGSPADKAGLLPGDVVTHVNEKWVMSHSPFAEAAKLAKDFSVSQSDKRKAIKEADELNKNSITLEEATDALYKVSKDPVNLKVLRKKESISVSLSPEMIKPEAVVSRQMDKSVGYIKVNFFTTEAAQSFEEQLSKLTSAGVSSLVIDLRNTPGGVVPTAQKIAGALIPGKPFATLLTKGRKQEIIAKPTSAKAGVKIIALVNEGTEGTAEVLAGALKDAGIKLIGNTTWGNAFETTAFRLSDGSGYTLTTGKFLTPKGVNFNRTGIKPDAVVPMSPSLIGKPGDSQLTRAVTVITRPPAGGAS